MADSVDVDISGVSGELKKNVRVFLSIAAEHDQPWSASRIKRLHARATGEIQSALQPFGYYQPEITESLKAEGDNWQASYKIDPGPATKIDALQLRATGDGKDNAAAKKVLAQTQLRVGERLRHSQYEATKSALQQTAYSAGYLDADYSQSTITVHPESQRAEIKLVLNTGPRYYFGPISIKQDILNDDFVRRYVKIHPGDPFNADRLTDLQLALSDTDYFSQVEIEAERKNIIEKPVAPPRTEQNTLPRLFFRRLDGAPTQPQAQVPVVVRAKPGKSQKYLASVGYGTDTGPRVGVGVEFRRVNRRGHHFRSDLRISQIKQTLTSRYSIPINNVARDRLAFDATIKREEVGDAITQSGVLSAAREDGWRFGRRRFYLNLERENFDFSGPSRTSNLLYPGATLTFQVADDALHTRRGLSLSADVHGGSDAVISSTSFLQTVLSGKSVLPLGPRGRLLTRATFGATETNNFSSLPPSQRFFTGGDRTVRGYAYQTISPENADGDDIGGQYLALGSVEAEYLVYGNFGLAVFFDAGDSAQSIGGLSAKRGVGIGGRWLSPVGTVRVDFAHPLDDPDTAFRFHFSLGPDL